MSRLPLPLPDRVELDGDDVCCCVVDDFAHTLDMNGVFVVVGDVGRVL